MKLRPLDVRRPLRRAVAVTAMVSILAVSTSGCSLFDFGGHDSFDEWYAGPRDAFDPDSIGCSSLDGSFAGYVLNDMLLRAPVMLVHETTRTAVLPLAASWYGVRYCFDADEHPQAAPTRREAGAEESTSPPGGEEAAEEEPPGGETPGEEAPGADAALSGEGPEAAEAEEPAAAEEAPEEVGPSSATSEDGDSPE